MQCLQRIGRGLAHPIEQDADNLVAARISAIIAEAVAGCAVRACSCFDSAEFLGVLVDQQGVAANCWADPANAWTGPGVGIKNSSGRSTCGELPTLATSLDFPRMETGELRVDVYQLRASASQWRELSTRFSVLASPTPGRPCQPTTAAVGGAHTAVGLAAEVLTIRTQATTGAVKAGAEGYGSNEVTAAGEMAAVRPRMV
ncbi:hypothetical protein MKAN_02080 [Mycobacterium kansasii ATCC 12478]|nr:hypothetical protein MKAN_02080 [Mycobacterium kansasii ATCC 12478]